MQLGPERIAGAGAESEYAGALFEASRGSDEALAIVRALVDWLADPAQTGLRRAFAVWFGRVVQVRAVSRS